MNKPVKDMTPDEKRARIEHLAHKFYDINTTPSTILHEEMQYATTDQHMLEMLKHLETLETARYHIEDECSTKLAIELRPLKRIYEYEMEQLMKQQEKERIVPPFDPFRHDNRAETAKRHKQEIEKLKKDHEKQTEKVRSTIMLRLKVYDNQIRSVFMDAVRYIYR